MSRFDAAIDLVLRELDRRRDAGHGDWRANSADAVGRLRSARPHAADGRRDLSLPP